MSDDGGGPLRAVPPDLGVQLASSADGPVGPSATAISPTFHATMGGAVPTLSTRPRPADLQPSANLSSLNPGSSGAVLDDAIVSL